MCQHCAFGERSFGSFNEFYEREMCEIYVFNVFFDMFLDILYNRIVRTHKFKLYKSTKSTNRCLGKRKNTAAY